MLKYLNTICAVLLCIKCLEFIDFIVLEIEIKYKLKTLVFAERNIEITII